MSFRTRLILLAFAIVPCCARPDAADPDRQRPNVVLVVMDTTRADRCSVNGYRKLTTPSLSALASEGALFRNVWSPSPWTGPAHASLFTGLRPERHRYLEGRMRSYLSEMPTLAGWFTQAGYRTACFSNNALVSREYGLDQGFEFSSRDFEVLDRPYPWAPATHRAALDWVRRAVDEDRNFFLFVNDLEPHAPYTPPEEFEARFVSPVVTPQMRTAGRAITHEELALHLLSALRLEPATIQVLSDLYDGEVASLDRDVGVLADGLRQMGILDRTVFVVVADHGENFGEHGYMDHKGSLHRTTLHVPLVIRYPGRFAAGTIVDDLVRLEDIPPTLLDACGLTIPGGLDGESLLGALGGRLARATFLPMTKLVEEMRARAPRKIDLTRLSREIRSVHDGRWHYITYSDGSAELYDLHVDPRETNNLVGMVPEQVRRLGALLPKLPLGEQPADPGLPPR